MDGNETTIWYRRSSFRSIINCECASCHTVNGVCVEISRDVCGRIDDDDDEESDENGTQNNCMTKTMFNNKS